MSNEKSVPIMEVVQAFHAELSALYELKPPISKAKMNSITKSAIKAIKMYKHVVLSVERFIAKCRPEYKLPGLYVIDSIVRQSRHQFGQDRDAFGPRFMRNFNQTFHSLFKSCPQNDKPKIVRVLNLWQRNNVFSTEVIQPLLDMANPNAKLQADGSPATESTAMAKSDSQIVLQYLADKSAHNKANHAANAATEESQSQIRFNKKLLDFDYDDDDEEKGDTPTEDEPVSRTMAATGKDEADTNPLALSFAQNLLSNPELLKMMQHASTLQHSQPPPHANFNQSEANNNSGSTSFAPSFHSLPGEQQQARSDNNSHNDYPPFGQYGSNDHRHPPGTDSADFGVMAEHVSGGGGRYGGSRADDRREYGRRSGRDSSQSPKRTSRRTASRWSRSRSRSPQQRNRHSPKRRNDPYRAAQEQRPVSPATKEHQHQRERHRRGLPPIRPGYLTICSTTLWLGHVPKLVSEADISNAFGEYGTITSIDLIPPRGCAYVAMDRRQDASAALKNSKSLKLQGNPIKVAWAPGKGTKAREFKDFWDVELGASFIPHSKISENSEFELLEEGGMFDEETIPEYLQELLRLKKSAKEEKSSSVENISQVGNVVPPAPAFNHMQQNMPGLIVPPPPLLPQFDCPPGPVPPPPLLEPPFNAPPLNIPPPSIISGPRPPPLSAWSNAPPLSGANAQRQLLPPHSFRPSFRPPHSRMNPGRHSSEPPPPFPPPPGDMPINPGEDDPFAPSAYELKAMKSGGRFILQPDMEPQGPKW